MTDGNRMEALATRSALPAPRLAAAPAARELELREQLDRRGEQEILLGPRPEPASRH